MLYNKLPLDNGNATIITRKAALETKIVMKRFENIFDFFSEEPVSIFVKENIKGDTEDKYECILRIRIWNTENECCSWSIFSKDRKELDNLIIRKVLWDMETDIEFAKKNVKQNRDLVLATCPSIVISNNHIPSPNSNQVIQLIKAFDTDIENGFVLYENNNPTWEWRDLEILRLYDWGQIHLTWCTDKKNDVIEEKIKELILNLDSVIEKFNETVLSMNLYYDTLPEQFKDI